MSNSKCIRRIVLISAILNAIIAVPLTPKDRSSSSSVELKSIPDTENESDADASRSIEQLEDDMSSGENTIALQLLNTTDEETNDFAVRLARALQKMQFSHVPPTIVLNDQEVIEHTHVEEEPALQLARDVGHFAVAARPPPISQTPPKAPANAVNAGSKVGNRLRWNWAPEFGSAAVEPSAGNTRTASRGVECCDSNVYNGPVIVISNVKDLKVMNPPPPQDSDNQNENEPSDDSEDDDSAGNSQCGNDLNNII